jgi:hypothetical protein
MHMAELPGGSVEILRLRSGFRHLSYGASQKTRIAAIERADVRKVDPRINHVV